MTALDLAAIEARVQAATPGPWTTKWIDQDPRDPSTPAVGIEGPEHFGYEGDDYYDIVRVDKWNDGVSTGPNAEFIAHAITDIPLLLARVKELEQWDIQQEARITNLMTDVQHFELQCADLHHDHMHDLQEIEDLRKFIDDWKMGKK